MSNTPLFGQVLEDAGLLSVDEQEMLVDVVRHRLVENRREEILQDIRDAEQEFQEGKARLVTAEDLIEEIFS